MTQIWSTPGGVHPPENKSQSMQRPLGEVSLPTEMIFPLNQHIGVPAEPIVQPGDRVLAGQKIAAAKGVFSANIHASTSGVVTTIEDRTLPHPSGMSGSCIVLQPDGLDEFIQFQPCDDYLAHSKEQLLDKIREAGITGMGGAGFPTAVKLNPKSIHTIHTLIINGTECEPYITADDMLMQTRADDLIKGTELLAHLLGNPARVIIGIEDNKPDAIASVTKAATGTNIEVVSFPTKYPSGGEKQLIQILTGKEVPSGDIPASIGIVLHNVGTAVAAYEAVCFGKPLIERITTVVGEALDTQRNVIVRLGTPIHHVLEEHGFVEKKASRLIVGGPMMGYALEQIDVPVIKTTNCLLAPSKKELPPPVPAQACIRCGMCAEACPAGLLPQQMYWYARAEEYERLEAQNIKDCIECGACSYVCPSNIPLVQYYRAAKGTMKQIAIDKEKSDRSRQRFEFRQERIAKAEAEKEAKRLARKQAAEAAKQKLEAQKTEAAEHADQPASSGPSSTQSLAAAAMAGIPAKQQSTEEQKARLERAVLSAEGRIEKLQQKLSAAEDEMKDKFAAQLKQVELKLADAQKKLSEFNAAASNSTTEPLTSDTPSAPDAPNISAATDPNDPVAAAIARAQAKMSMSPEEKLKANIESLQGRLSKAQAKLAAAQAEGSDKADALQIGVDKLNEKIAAATEELTELSLLTSPPAEQVSAASEEQDAATAAIERAKAKAAAQATMSADDKLKEQLAAAEKRLQKARERLAKAEAEDDPNLDAFRGAVEKSEAKLQKLKSDSQIPQ